ncbi:Uncharacterized protein Adt_46053 [Abeliophyllum distichum]|uniref:Uncharacterized protein n=1 Tax=Abeliophyllum distichum TaxID=126358 RepID=A0ABD1P385_9LAMI
MGPAVTPSVTVHGETDLHEMRPMVSLEKNMEEMMARKIDDALSKRKDRRRQMVLEEDPFAPEIMAVPLLKGFKKPMIEAYDGVTDPLDHLRTFVDLNPDEAVCSARRSNVPVLSANVEERS